MDLIFSALRVLLGLVIILVVLALFGISPREAGEWIGGLFSGLGDFFRGVREGS